MKSRAISEQGRDLKGRGCLAAFFLIFALGGAAFSIPFIILPVVRLVRAQSWTPTPCTIVESKLETSRGSENDTYRAAVRYRYVVDGKTYLSDQRSADGSIYTSARSSAMNAVNRFPAGRSTVCFVNPSRPDEAILERTVAWSLLLFGLIPAVFILIGVGGFYAVLRRPAASGLTGGSPTSSQSVSPLPTRKQSLVGRTTPMPSRSAFGPLPLAARQGPRAKFFTTLLIACFWNGIVSLFVYFAVTHWVEGKAEWCLNVFLIPFVIVGLTLIGGTFHALLAMFNPAVQVTLQDSVLLPAGGSVVAWKIGGRSDRIHRLAVSLEGREVATYRQGTDTKTDKHVFHRSQIAEVTRPVDIASGKRAFTIPAGAIHSFAAPNNRIVWELEVHGEIAGWPDLKQQFPINISPALPIAGLSPAAATSGELGAISPSTQPAEGEVDVVLDGEREGYLPGEPVGCHVRWNLRSSAVSPISVRLIWYTRGKGSQDVSIVQEEQIASPGLSGDRHFQFKLPSEPYSFSGKLISVCWAIEAVVGRGKQSGRAEFVMSADRMESVLPQQAE